MTNNRFERLFATAAALIAAIRQRPEPTLALYRPHVAALREQLSDLQSAFAANASRGELLRLVHPLKASLRDISVGISQGPPTTPEIERLAWEATQLSTVFQEQELVEERS